MCSFAANSLFVAALPPWAIRGSCPLVAVGRAGRFEFSRGKSLLSVFGRTNRPLRSSGQGEDPASRGCLNASGLVDAFSTATHRNPPNRPCPWLAAAFTNKG
jgi:hypothetical protein